MKTETSLLEYFCLSDPVHLPDGKISGTVYALSGSFEGYQNMLRKLERITAQNFSVEMEEDA